MKNKSLLFLAILLFVFSGCAAQKYESAMPAYDTASSMPGGYAEENTYTSYTESDSGIALSEAAAVDVTRVVIKNASLSIIADDPAAMMDYIARMAEEKGGFIVTSNLYKTQTDRGLEIPRANITIRVPAEQLTAILDEIKAQLANTDEDVRNENISGEDVTREYTDLQSRLSNLEQAKVRLEGIMEEAVRTEDVLDVFNELTAVTEQIEVLKGRIQYYDEASRLSSVAIDIVARESIKEITIGGWQPAGVARNAIQALVDTMQFLVNAAIWIGLYILPVLLCLAIPVVLIFLVVRRAVRHQKLRKQKKQASTEPVVEIEANQES